MWLCSLADRDTNSEEMSNARAGLLRKEKARIYRRRGKHRYIIPEYFYVEYVTCSATAINHCKAKLSRRNPHAYTFMQHPTQ
jgi:hypothetical protein